MKHLLAIAAVGLLSSVVHAQAVIAKLDCPTQPIETKIIEVTGSDEALVQEVKDILYMNGPLAHTIIEKHEKYIIFKNAADIDMKNLSIAKYISLDGAKFTKVAYNEYKGEDLLEETGSDITTGAYTTTISYTVTLIPTQIVPVIIYSVKLVMTLNVTTEKKGDYKGKGETTLVNCKLLSE